MKTNLAPLDVHRDDTPQSGAAPQPDPAPQSGASPQPGQAGTPVSVEAPAKPGGFSPAWRKVRVPLGLVALVVMGGIIIALLAPRPKSNTYLDPASGDLDGVKALTAILSDRGFHVVSTYSPAGAIAAVGQGQQQQRTPTTLVITSPSLLTASQRAQLARTDADLFVVEPRSAALSALAPAIRIANGNAPIDGPVRPACGITEARLAGPADLGGITYRIPRYATGCYPVKGDASLVRYRQGGRTITVMGTGLPLTDESLQAQGNAALALNLLDGSRTIVWLTPEPTIAPAAPGPSQGNGPVLIPGTAWLVVLQLFVALVFAALWRMRRFGPLITERLPVVVRASETVEGHARLYQSRRARDRAASVLRAAVLGRIKPALGLTADAPMAAVVAGLASRSRLQASKAGAVLDGPPPGTDADLVALATELDELEREVRSQ
ncbi:MAG TPA: DUF4350 domain-containing protein [Streptosporangiaceae bacterium]|nr:DUF4350 domain-containing protein [Streptosporangiaceae bacterium]